MENSPRKVIAWEEWKKMLNDVIIRKEDMNKLVMNFLVTEGYDTVARDFLKESGTQHIDLATMSTRAAVKGAILCGKVEDAFKILANSYRGVLHRNPLLFFHVQQQRFIELIRNGEVEKALDFGQKFITRWGKINPHLLKEIERTAALLAFKDPADCPVGELLGISQLLKTANEVNVAILTSEGHEKDSKLSNVLKKMIWVQYQLNKKAVFPQGLLASNQR